MNDCPSNTLQYDDDLKKERGMKTCSRCKIEKSEGEFYKDKRYKNRLQSCCKTCARENTKRYFNTPRGKESTKKNIAKYRQTPKGKEVSKVWRESTNGKLCMRKAHLKMNYGITIEYYDDILKAQGGVCAICGTDVPGGTGRFHVDHDHKTGKIRGLLCSNCNAMLGYSKDSIDIHLNAIKYLNRACTNP
jgi:hypothetical protein